MRKAIFILLMAVICSPSVNAQIQVKVMHYNVLNFGNACGSVTASQKYTWLETIINHYRPDIFTVNEFNPNQAYANGVKQLSFSYTTAVANADFTNLANSNIANQLFYNTDKFGYAGVEVIGGNLRDVNVYTLYLKPEITQVGEDTTFLYCIVAHLKAGQGGNNESQRNTAAVNIMNWVGANAADKNILLMGDMNVYFPAEPAFQRFIANSNADISFIDPINKINDWSGPNNAIVHTQSTRSSSNDCGAGGGMDDRFDMILMSPAISNELDGISYVPESYAAFGNDGTNYNTELMCDGTPVPTGVCAALKQMSDHLPVVLELNLSRAVNIEANLISELELKYAPNPFDQHLKVSLAVDQPKNENWTLKLINAQGQIIYYRSLKAESQEIDINTLDLPAGIYLLSIQNAQGESLRKKLLKQ
ncbi:MAG: T9SS type A sorting domain-containing protein [Bacteroidota bacterium]